MFNEACFGGCVFWVMTVKRQPVKGKRNFKSALLKHVIYYFIYFILISWLTISLLSMGS